MKLQQVLYEAQFTPVFPPFPGSATHASANTGLASTSEQMYQEFPSGPHYLTSEDP